jgi:flagellar biosynthesis/type III secretory pathway M-ring protein FliF/YscJ
MDENAMKLLLMQQRKREEEGNFVLAILQQRGVFTAWLTEILVVVFIVLYGVVFAYGMSRKRRMRRLLEEVIKPTLKKQFLQVEDTFGDGLNELLVGDPVDPHARKSS